jgi:hypothetical protein
MSPKGFYPSTPFLNKNAIFIPEHARSIVYSVTRFTKEDWEHHYAEMMWAYVSEIRLWASLILSIPEDFGHVCIYPRYEAVLIDDFDFPADDLSDKQCCQNISDMVFNKLNGLDYGITAKYEFQSYNFNHNIQTKLYNAINPKLPLLIRGLSFLIKSQIVSRNYLLTEEAALLVYIALEAALRIIRNGLIEQGIKNPSFDQVFEKVKDKFPSGEDLADYFRECYDNRIMIVHPENDFGSYYIPPLQADDFFDTYTAVVDFFRYLLIEE